MRIRIYLILVLGLGGCNKQVDPNCIEKPFEQGRICTQILMPVCGCNGKTYSNACEAEGYGIKNYSQGECKGH